MNKNNIPPVNDTFRIGLCMAGAVSAGAYTAGVMDYLLEALADWEQKKNADSDNTIPKHKVKIPVMGGASAGGMTAMLTATVLNNPITPVHLETDNKIPAQINNKLYESWVNLIADDMFPKLLSSEDIESGKVESMLNSNFIDEVTNKMICYNKEAPWLTTPAYIEKPLKLFTTLSNLEGFKYNTAFNSSAAQQKYNMAVHNDYACFELFDKSMNDVPRTKGWMPLNFQTNDNVDIAKEAAMATGAFPIGLKARLVHRKADEVNEIPFLEKVFANTKNPDGVVKTLNIDGGMINNEPFDKVRDVLDKITVRLHEEEFKGSVDKQEHLNEINCLYSSFENTVVMIDPFPSTEAGKFDFSQAIPNVIGKTLSAMLSQMRAKPVTYRAANASGDASQFIVTPSRKIPSRKDGSLVHAYGDKAIACGTLAGFGGFLNKEFREHDYFLGRFNCEIFLRDHFTIPEDCVTDHPIFGPGYKNINLDPYRSKTNPKEIQIIPIFSKRRKKGDFPMPQFLSKTNWPTINEEAIDGFKHPVRNRIQSIVLNIGNWNCFTRFLLLLVSQFGLNRMIGNKVLTVIKDSLYDWQLISDYVPESKASKIRRFKTSVFWNYWLMTLILTLAIIGVFQFPYFNVPNIINVELETKTQALFNALHPLIKEHPETIEHNLYLDFGFITTYSLLFYFSGKLFNILGWLTGKRVLLICLLPGLLDLIENCMMFQMLSQYSDHYEYPYFNLFHWIVVFKWVLAVLGFLLVLLVTGKKVFGKEE